jgi:hypothetical protein
MSRTSLPTIRQIGKRMLGDRTRSRAHFSSRPILMGPRLMVGAPNMLPSSIRILPAAAATFQRNPRSERRWFMQWGLPREVVVRLKLPLPPSPRRIGSHRHRSQDLRQSHWRCRRLSRLQSVIWRPSTDPSICALRAMRFRSRVVPWPTNPGPV